jgi:hypothetical protein
MMSTARKKWPVISIAGASSCKRALADEVVTAVRTLGTDVDRERRWVVAPVSRGDGGVRACRVVRGYE